MKRVQPIRYGNARAELERWQVIQSIDMPTTVWSKIIFILITTITNYPISTV